MAKANEQGAGQKPSLIASVSKAVRESPIGQAEAWMSRNSEQSFWGQMAAMGRELVNDVRGTFMQVMFGQPEHPQGVGVPLSPTPQLVTEALTGEKPDRQTDRIGGNTTTEPAKEQGKWTMDDFRAFAAEKAKEAEHKMDHQNDMQQPRDGQEREGRE